MYIYNKKHCKQRCVYWTNTLPVKDRFLQHMKPSVHKKNYKLYRGISNIGKENFYYEVLEDDIPIEELNEKEIYYIEKYNSYKYGYNSTKGGDGRLINKIEDLSYIIEQLKLGRYSTDIARELGISTATIKRALQREGLTPHDFRKVDEEKIIELYKNNVPHIEIGKILDINPRTVSRVINKYNIPKKRKRYNYENIDDNEILNDIHNGIKPKEIATKYNISVDYVYKLIKNQKETQSTIQ